MRNHPQVSKNLIIYNFDTLLLPIQPRLDKIIKQYEEGKYLYIRDHIQLIDDNISNSQSFLMYMFQNIIPIRDPFLSLLTANYWSNEPLTQNNYIERLKPWSEFIKTVELLKARKSLNFACLDLIETRDEKINLLKNILDNIGIDDNGYSQECAENWVPLNSKTPSAIKEKYKNRDIDFFEKNNPDELNILRYYEKELRPFLESIGYKNLMWWS